MADESESHESPLGTILGWGFLAVFAIGFGWYVGAPLIMGEKWSDKQPEAIELVKNQKPTGTETLYDMIRGYSLRAKEKGLYVGEFNWNATQRDGAEYEVSLLWTEGSDRKVAVWRVNLKTKDIRPQGDQASGLAQRIAAPPAPKS